MQTADILLKLLPFTVKDHETGVVSFSYNLSIGDWIITGIEITLILIFLYSIIKLYTSYRRDYKNTQLLYDETINLKKNGFSYYPEFIEKISKNKNISHLWNEFDESLIKKNNTIENSLDSSYFFNEHSLASHVGSKFYSSIPGILLGIGLLGTFLALYVALAQLHLGGTDTGEMKTSIIHFVEMVGIKFTASVWGILLSVIFTIYEKTLEGKLSSKIKHLQDNIDEAFKRQTAEQNLSLLLTESEQQTLALNSLAETLTQRISEQFNPVISQMNDHLQQMPIHISNAIGESLKEPLQALQQNASSAAETQSESLGTIVKTFVDKLEETTGTHAKEFQTRMDETTSELTHLIGSIKEISEDQNAMQKDRENKMQELFTRTMTSFEEQMNQMKGVFSEVSLQATSTMQSMAQEQHNKLIEEREAISSQSQQITNEMERLLSTLATEATQRDSKVEKLMEMISSQHTNLFESNKAFAMQMEETVKKIMNAIVLKVADVQSVINESAGKLSAVPAMLDTFAHSSSNLQEFANTTNDATEYLSATVSQLKDVETSISEQLQTLSGVTNAMNEASSNSVSILTSSGEVAERLQKVYEEIITDNTDNLETLGQAMSQWLSDYDRQVHSTMQNSLSEVQSALSNFANTLTSSIGTLEDAIENLNEKIQG
jgi:ABC-type transporter Mla subunit MlaD